MKNQSLIPVESIQSKIYVIRKKKVMLDRNLAELYGVENKVLNQAVKRNLERFPNDFMFQLRKDEFQNLKSQFVTSSWGGIRKLPFAFTEQGVAMLSSVLRSKRAIRVNIQIMRTFTKIRVILSSNKKLRQKLEEMESKYDKQFKLVFDAIRTLMVEEEKPKKKMGF